MSGATPESVHRKLHRYWDKPLHRCRECQAARRRCQAKVRYLTGDAARAVALEKNLEMGWARMLAVYRCPYCTMYHLTRAKPGTARYKRAEKQRRKWLASAGAMGRG